MSAMNRLGKLTIVGLALCGSNLTADEPAWNPFPVDWSSRLDGPASVSFLLDCPAGKDGFIRAQRGHLVRARGDRFRIWGVNITAKAAIPTKEAAPRLSAHLARLGINCVRLHFLDRVAPQGLIDAGRNDTCALDPAQLDRLDFFVAQLRDRGIYTNLNLNVGRTYKMGDGVPDYELLGFAKSLTYFHPRLIELQKQYACEGIPILAAYAALHDWDGVFWYTLAHDHLIGEDSRAIGHFDLGPDPIKMTQLAAGALMFLRADVHPAEQTVGRSYSIEQVYESLRLPSSESPYFTPGFPTGLSLVHATRITSLSGPPSESFQQSSAQPFISDTRELRWIGASAKLGVVVVDTARSQAVIGFSKENPQKTENLSLRTDNPFSAVTLSSLDEKRITQSGKLLLTASARVSNSGMQWNDKRTTLTRWGTPPSLIEPVTGRAGLLNLEEASAVSVQPLDGAGQPLGPPLPATKTDEGWDLRLGDPATTWYLVTVTR